MKTYSSFNKIDIGYNISFFASCQWPYYTIVNVMKVLVIKTRVSKKKYLRKDREESKEQESLQTQ